MKRSNCLFLTAVLIQVLVSNVGLAETLRQPNVIFFLIDDPGYSDVSCYGATKVKTPDIDRLTADGLRLSNYLSACRVCSPCRNALLTGRYPQRNGLPVCPNDKPEAPDWYEHVGLPQSRQRSCGIWRRKYAVNWATGIWRGPIGQRTLTPATSTFRIGKKSDGVFAPGKTNQSRVRSAEMTIVLIERKNERAVEQ